MLCNLYSKPLFNNALDQINDGVKVNGVQISSDTILIADTDADSQCMFNQVYENCRDTDQLEENYNNGNTEKNIPVFSIVKTECCKKLVKRNTWTVR